LNPEGKASESSLSCIHDFVTRKLYLWKKRSCYD